jgi:fatty-acyl-CoA synthase
VNADFSLAALHAALATGLPRYARPVFLRICDHLETTGTFKPIKAALMHQGYDAANLTDAVFVDDPALGRFVRLAGGGAE